jgi:eukaryotic-like serine/threonine-protein kinase
MSVLLPRLATALSGRYTIVRPIGEGGMATVYLARDDRHSRDVAIKVLHPDLAAVLGGDRFLREITTTAQLQHPHILPLLDSGAADGLLFYVMPLVTGETLRARLERERQLPIDEALRYAREVADALGHAHAQGIIHRDIKPENILLQGGHAVVADFGIALAVESAGGQRMTQTGLSLGTPQYMSPEQAMGERTIDARSDLYALGAVTYEMLVGEAPFTGPSVQAIISRVVSEEPRPISTQRKAVPLSVEAAVLQALEKLPADRFATAAAFSAALDAAPGATIGRTAGRHTVRASGGGRVTTLLGVTAGVLAIVAAWGWWRPTAAPEVLRYRLRVDSIVDTRDWNGSLAISPDGRRIVRASGYAGPLLVRTRDAVDFVPIPGTEGAQAPFFSPDGAQVAFFSSGRLLSVPSAGGPATVLRAAYPLPVAGWWSDDGNIYMEGRTGADQIYRMRAEPEAPLEQVTLVDSASGEASHMLPHTLPGGRALLFHVAFRDGRMAIALGDPATRTHRILFPGTRARYSTSGHVIYATEDGALWAVPFDLDALAVRGDAVRIGAGLPSTMVGPVDFGVSRNGTLVFQQEERVADRELVWVSRSGVRTQLDPSWVGGFVSPRISPDGRQVAVTLQLPTESHIWIRSLAGGTPRRFTQGSVRYDEPSWTPDGRSLSYLIGQGGTVVGGVQRRALDGGGAGELVLAEPRSFSEQTWSPTGGWILVRTTTPTDGSGDVLAFRPGVDLAARPVVASSRSEYTPSVSPDGRWLAYASNESGRLEVYVVPFPEAGDRKWQISTDGGTSPAWSPRGGELFFLDQRANMMAVAVETRAEFVPGAPKVLFSAASNSTRSVSRRNYDVSKDGERFLMIQRASGANSAQLVVVEQFDAALPPR